MCQHTVLRKIAYLTTDGSNYICATDEHPECHQTFKVEVS